jgi:hypothetical protein
VRPLHWLLFCISLLLGGQSLAQDLEDENPIPPAPANLVLDEARVFARDPQRLAVVSETLGILEDRHGYRLYLATYSTLIGRSLKDQAALLEAKWLAGQPGMVLVLEVDSYKFQFGQAPPLKDEIEPGKVIERIRPTDFSFVELEHIISELDAPLKAATADRAAFAETLSTGLAAKLSITLDQRAAAPVGNTRGRMVILAIGLLAVTGLLALLAVAGLKRAEARSRDRLVFPKAAVGIRLGAPYGGGKVSSRHFGK